MITIIASLIIGVSIYHGLHDVATAIEHSRKVKVVDTGMKVTVVPMESEG